MAQIYGQATNVCVWLGAGNAKTHQAIKFIKDRVLKLETFDKLVQDASTASDWVAVNKLMRNAWFSRRWVVQEIALADKATLHCGKDMIKWQEFATAVSLFSHVETQSQVFSKMVKKDSKYNNIPGFFSNISELSATRLVDATSNLIRRSKTGLPDQEEPAERLQSLEYLVSTLSNFQASEPGDIIYALLAIARDTSPRTAKGETPYSFSFSPATLGQLVDWGSKNIGSQVYLVDYTKPFFEVCKDFITFAIRKSESTSALDILCRPWAPELDALAHHRIPVTATFESSQQRKEKRLPSWIPRLSDLTRPFAIPDVEDDDDDNTSITRPGMDRLNADALVGLPTELKPYRAAGARSVSKFLSFESGGEEYDDYESLFVEGFILDTVEKLEERSQGGMIPYEWLILGGWQDRTKPPPEELWRTLVADRGPNGRNVAAFYNTACGHALRPGPKGGPINTETIVSYGGCSVVVDFMRRVQAVIWNRKLMRTGSRNYLGLVPKATEQGDLIAILYGCTVPVVLRRLEKTEKQMRDQRNAREKQDRERAAVTIQRSWRRKVIRRREAARVHDFKQEAAEIDPPSTKAGSPSTPSKSTRAKSSKRRRETAPDEIGTPHAKRRSRGMAGLVEEPDEIHLPETPRKHKHYCLRCQREFKRAPPEAVSLSGEPYKPKEPDLYFYEFLGESYVHGMMNGEAITVKGRATQQDLDSDLLRSLVFELR